MGVDGVGRNQSRATELGNAAVQGDKGAPAFETFAANLNAKSGGKIGGQLRNLAKGESISDPKAKIELFKEIQKNLKEEPCKISENDAKLLLKGMNFKTPIRSLFGFTSIFFRREWKEKASDTS